jgi:hypothetical protein
MWNQPTNQVVSKRMVKKQMHWTPRGAHLLLQVRTRVLNDELWDIFSRWYLGAPLKTGFSLRIDDRNRAAKRNWRRVGVLGAPWAG